MIVLKKYQEEAVDGLLKNTYQLLKMPGARKKMVFKAPTGAGKTVTMAAFLNKLSEEIPDKFDLPLRKVTYIWIAPNQLHLQSYLALKNYFSELRSIRPIQFEDVTDGKLKPNEVLFLNWQSINKESNLYIRENEQDKTLISYVNRAKLDDTEIIVILDEAHLFASKGKAAAEILQGIFGKIEIDVSATPLYNSDYYYTIKRQEVVEAEMIKQNILLNPALDHTLQHGKTLNQVLLDLALDKRKELQNTYEKLGKNINPLLLIQLPNDSSIDITPDELKIKEEVITYLEVKGITTNNHKLAIWLSKDYTNLEGVEKYDSITEILFFKQAISLGWDCPRAAVLLIFREMKKQVFTIQTVGRILRMPEQVHYSETILNYGYVYTDLSKNMIEVVKDDMDYIVQYRAIRKEPYIPISLPSIFINTRIIRNRLGAEFRKCLYQAAEEKFDITRNLIPEGFVNYNKRMLKTHLIRLDVENIEIPIPRDVEITGEEGATEVDKMERFAKTQSELDLIFRQFCRQNVGGFAVVDSSPVLELALKMLFEDYLTINEYDAVKIILFEENKPKFVDMIELALELYTALLHQAAQNATKRVERYIWDVPPEKLYNDNYEETPSAKHILEPFYQYNGVSSPERDFVTFLENNKDYIEWWYKNGVQNKEDFAVSYEDKQGITRGFYVDFILRLKNGTIALFDTKTLDSDKEFISKHNALISYLNENSKSEKQIIGGVIIPKRVGDVTLWKYCENPITSSTDTTGWSTFDPSKFKI